MRNMTAFLLMLVLASPVVAQMSDRNEIEVRKLIPAFTDFWARSDAQGLASLFASDGDLIIPTGNVFSGREMIGGFYSSVFAEGYRGSKGTGEIVRMRFVRPDVAVGDGTWSITGAHDKQGRESAPEQGVFTFVAAKKAGQWRISALREQTSATTLKTSEQ